MPGIGKRVAILEQRIEALESRFATPKADGPTEDRPWWFYYEDGTYLRFTSSVVPNDSNARFMSNGRPFSRHCDWDIREMTSSCWTRLPDETPLPVLEYADMMRRKECEWKKDNCDPPCLFRISASETHMMSHDGQWEVIKPISPITENKVTPEESAAIEARLRGFENVEAMLREDEKKCNRDTTLPCEVTIITDPAHVLQEQLAESERKREEAEEENTRLQEKLIAAIAREDNTRESNDELKRQLAKRYDLLETAWGVIANAHFGDWESASKDWRTAAERWRDQCHVLQAVRKATGVEETPKPKAEKVEWRDRRDSSYANIENYAIEVSCNGPENWDWNITMNEMSGNESSQYEARSAAEKALAELTAKSEQSEVEQPKNKTVKVYLDYEEDEKTGDVRIVQRDPEQSEVEQLRKRVEHAEQGHANVLLENENLHTELTVAKKRCEELEKQLCIAAKIESGNAREFDWAVLGKIDELETQLAEATRPKSNAEARGIAAEFIENNDYGPSAKKLIVPAFLAILESQNLLATDETVLRMRELEAENVKYRSIIKNVFDAK